MTKTDRTDLENDFMNTWKGLAKILWVAALNSEIDFGWERFFHFAHVIEVLSKSERGANRITDYHKAELLSKYLPPLTNKVNGKVDLKDVLTQETVDNFKEFAKDVEKHLKSFRHALQVGLEAQES